MEFPPSIGGVQKYLYEIAFRLQKQHQVVVITPESEPIHSQHTPRRMKPVPENAIGYFNCLLRLKPDRVLVGHSHPQLLLPAHLYRPASFASIAYGNDFLAGQKRWHHRFFNYLLRHSKPLVTITHSNATRLAQLGIFDTVVVHPGTNPDYFYPPKNIAQKGENINLISVCRLVPRKGIDNTLKALAHIVPIYPNITYNIVGTGPDHSRLKQIANDLRLNKNVKFWGHVSDTKLRQLYQFSDIFVMISREELQASSIEGFGIVYLEASASGLPVIAGLSGGAAEAVIDGETGFLVDPHNPKALRDTLLKLIKNPNLRQQMGVAGRKWVKETMNWDRAADEILYLLQNNI